MTIAYLVSQYPAPSHTFIRREIAALRASGIKIVTFSVQPAPETTGAVDREARAQTEALLGRGMLAYPLAVVTMLLTHPVRWFAALGLALRERPPGVRALIWSIFHFVEALVLAGLLARIEAKRVHVHFANSGATVGILAASIRRIPFSLTIHGISETDYPAGLLLERRIARADFVACASWFMRAQGMRHSDPSDWAKLQVVRCGIDLSALPDVPDDGPAGSDRTVRLICVGRLSPEKGHRVLLDALGHVLAQGSSVELELVGDGPERESLEAEAGLLPEAAVRFAGALPERLTLEHIAAADILVLPSFMEGLPIVLMEALALGKPVIASSVAGIPELVVHGENGLLVRPADCEALAAAIRTLAGDAELRRKFGAAGKVAVARKHAIDLAVAPLVAFFGGQPA